MRFGLVWKVWLVFAAACLGADGLVAQVARYELGLRLRAFERQLDAITEPERREAAFAELDKAVQAFFRLDTRSVAKAIDAADRALSGRDWSVAEQYAHSLQWELGKRLVSVGEASLPGKLRLAYEIDDDDFEPEGWSLVVEVPGAAKPVVIAVDELPQDVTIPLAGLQSGDHALRWSLRAEGRTLLAREQALSVVPDLQERMAKLLSVQKALKERDDVSIESKTFPALVRMLQGMQRRRAAETILPGAELMKEAEALADWLSGPVNGPHYGMPGSFRLRIPTDKGTTSVRLFVPESTGDVPLVVALHGAGGSENLFFDGYGDGRVVALAKERKWMVVAPRLAIGTVDCAALVEALAERFPVDRQRVVLVGHSMGAMQAVANACRTPDRYRAVAALGGSGRVRRSEALQKLRFFVGVGSKDFALGGAKGLQRALQGAGVASDYREYPGVEHLAIVQLALDDVFAFFDKVLDR